MKLIIADDHRIVREGLRLLLDREPDVEIVGEASDGDEVLELIEQTDPDVVLLDVRLQAVSGLDVLEQLAEGTARVRVLMLSMHDDPAYVKRALELGASGYLLKSVGRDELLRALATVTAGGSYVQGELTGPLVTRVLDPAGSGGPVGELSVRDIGILQMLADGLDNRSIARQMCVSEAAVKGLLRTLYARLEAHNRPEAVAVALRLGIIV